MHPNLFFASDNLLMSNLYYGYTQRDQYTGLSEAEWQHTQQLLHPISPAPLGCPDMDPYWVEPGPSWLIQSVQGYIWFS